MPRNFDEQDWMGRLAAAVERVAAEARPSYWQGSRPMAGLRQAGEYEPALHRQYRALAARAKRDPTAAAQFKQSSLRFDAKPVEAIAILKEHPQVQSALSGGSNSESIHHNVLNQMLGLGLKDLVLSLAKLSIKEGGEEAARRLHRYLTAGANKKVPAHEITVIHGLVVKTRLNLHAGAYLAPYEDVRTEFDLPDGPEPFAERTFPDAAALVRSLEYGPSTESPGDAADLPSVQVSYRFPAEYTVDLEGWFSDSKFLVDLLAIAKGVPLLSRTHYVRLARWIEEIDPNLAFGTRSSGGPISDVWPRSHDVSRSDVDAFLDLARGWHSCEKRPDAMNLAVRRLAGSFSRPGGRFGQEDRVLDVAIALEVFYGGKTGHKLAQRAAGLLEETAAGQVRVYDVARGFYDVRSSIVHWRKEPPTMDVIEEALEVGRDIACRTLANLLSHDEAPEWAVVAKRVCRKTRKHINAVRG